MARKRQARRCSGTRSTDGQPCEAWAINGGKVCSAHGGHASQVKAKAAVREIEQRAERLLYRRDAPAVIDHLEALQRLAGRALAVEEFIGEKVNELRSIRYTDEKGSEQLRSEMAVLERAMDRAGRLLVDIARLGIEERLARVTEKQAAMVQDALYAQLGEMGMTPAQQRDAVTGIGRRLRLVA